MSATLTQLQTLLAKQGSLNEDDIAKVVAEHGPLSEIERSALEAERYEKERSKGQAITLEQYLAASKVLDSAAEDSDDYKKALALVEAYENGN